MGNQGSGILRSASNANCLSCLAEDRGAVVPGELVQVQPFLGLIWRPPGTAS